MLKKTFLGVLFLLAINSQFFVFAKTHHPITQSKHGQDTHKNNTNTTISTTSNSQISIYNAHKEKNNYVIALYTDQSGKALITYDSPTCQANSYGNTIVNSKNKSEIEFTSTEDPLCKITMQKMGHNQLKVTKETPACTAWHGDFCSFSSLSLLTRIYP